jgi:DNA-binding LacI/PurR family transcriptional regulator
VISGLPDDPLRFRIPAERLQGYQEVLKEHDIEPRAELNAPGNFSYAGGAEAMTRLLAVPQPPTAVFAFSDAMAIGALRTIRDMGLRVPQDISVMGFDDQEVAEYVGLTTVFQPVAGYGERAADLLLRHFAGETDEAAVVHEHLPTKLVVRGTTGPRRR